jgi:hypothetical protein
MYRDIIPVRSQYAFTIASRLGWSKVSIASHHLYTPLPYHAYLTFAITFYAHLRLNRAYPGYSDSRVQDLAYSSSHKYTPNVALTLICITSFKDAFYHYAHQGFGGGEHYLLWLRISIILQHTMQDHASS